MNSVDYQQKYIKYKNKYCELKKKKNVNIVGGATVNEDILFQNITKLSETMTIDLNNRAEFREILRTIVIILNDIYNRFFYKRSKNSREITSKFNIISFELTTLINNFNIYYKSNENITFYQIISDIRRILKLIFDNLIHIEDKDEDVSNHRYIFITQFINDNLKDSIVRLRMPNISNFEFEQVVYNIIYIVILNLYIILLNKKDKLAPLEEKVATLKEKA